ncbi:MAG: hypothetical protein ACOYXC_01405 [Candidatus Rifleibacteriota bacterium]
MKKTVLIILAAVLIVPAMAFAAPGFYPGHNNGGFNHPSNGGGVPVHPGHNNGSNNNGYNNGGYNNGNNYGHPGHSNGGYNNGNNNGGYNGGYNNGNHNGGYNGGYNNGNNHGYPGNNNGGYNNGNNHGHPGHNNGGTMLNARIREAHRSIKRAFQEAENSYYPFLMSHSDKRRMGMALRRVMMELENLSSMVGPRFRDNLREVGMMIEKARFALTSEDDAGRAHRIMERAETKYNAIADILVR